MLGTSTPQTGSRLLLSLQAATPAPKQTLTQATVLHCHALQLDVQLANQGPRGRVHITHIDPPAEGAATSLQTCFAVGDVLPVVVMGTLASREGQLHRIAECSARSDVLAAARTEGAAEAVRAADVRLDMLRVGQELHGCVFW